MAATIYDDETRAKVLAAVAMGTSINALSKQSGISRTTIIRWRDESNIEVRTVPVQQKRDLGELVARYLDTGLKALEAEAQLFSDREWLKGQTAGDLAILHGVLADKLVRVLSSLEPAEVGNGID